MSWLTPLRAVARTVRNSGTQAITSLLWPVIRSRARRQLVLNGPWTRCVFLCYGNICRSPYAEAVARAKTLEHEDRIVESAGFFGPERTPPDNAIAAAEERGLDTRGHRSRVVTAELLEGADLVVVVEPAHRKALSRTVPSWKGPVVNLADLDPLHASSRSIPDPYGGPLDQFRSAFERIERCVRHLLEVSRSSDPQGEA